MVLAILLYEQIINHTQINMCLNTQFLNTKQRAYQSFLSYFLGLFRLHRCGTLNEYKTKYLHNHDYNI